MADSYKQVKSRMTKQAAKFELTFFDADVDDAPPLNLGALTVYRRLRIHWYDVWGSNVTHGTHSRIWPALQSQMAGADAMIDASAAARAVEFRPKTLSKSCTRMRSISLSGRPLIGETNADW